MELFAASSHPLRDRAGAFTLARVVGGSHVVGSHVAVGTSAFTFRRRAPDLSGAAPGAHVDASAKLRL